MARSKSKLVAFVAIYSALYDVVTYALPGISYEWINIRISDALQGLFPFCTTGVILGIVVSGIVANLASPVGWLDWISPFLGGFFWWLASKIVNRTVIGAFMLQYILFLPWLAYILNAALGGGYISWLILLAPQLFISEVIFPYILYRAVKKNKYLVNMLRNIWS